MKQSITPHLKRIIRLKPKRNKYLTSKKVRPLSRSLEFFKGGYLVRKIEGTTLNSKEPIVYNMRFYGDGPLIA